MNKIAKKRIADQIEKFKYQNQPLKFNLGTLVLTCLCIFLIVIATFTQFHFRHFMLSFDIFNYLGSDLSKPEIMSKICTECRYIPQIPVIMFIAAFLGRKFGLMAIITYILIGLFLAPVFALGGGLDYVFQYGFGFILGYIPAVFFASSILKSGLTYRNMAQATFVGVLIIHLIGVLYLLFVATLQRESFSLILGWIIAQSGMKILYDFLFSFIAMIVAKISKKVLWVAMG